MRATVSVMTVGSVLGRTPWPRLKMWPLAPRVRALSASCAMRRTSDSTAAGPAEQDGGIEVALQGFSGADATGGLVEGDAPVDAHDVRAHFAHGVQQFSGADTEVDARDARVGDLGEDPFRVRHNVFAVLGQRQGARPGVEQLHGVDARGDLGAQEFDGDVGEHAQQLMPGLRVGEHHRLGALVVLAGPALDEVGRQSERGTGESDQRDLIERVQQQLHSGRDRTHLLGAQPRQCAHVGDGAHRVRHHRADSRHDVQVDARGLERNDDVGEQDCRVHVVAADRLHGDLTHQLRIETGFQHADPDTEFTVFRKGPTGLSHEPHRTPMRHAAVGGDEEGGIGQVASTVSAHHGHRKGDPAARLALLGPPWVYRAIRDTARLPRRRRPDPGARRTRQVPRRGRGHGNRISASSNRARTDPAATAPGPYSYALGAEVTRPDTNVVPVDADGDAFGRLILLHDPAGQEAWHGVFRLVAYVQADIDSALAADPLLPEVAWSWLVDALDSRTPFTALGGTVTATSSVRYGDIAGPPRAHQLEVRASWTVGDTELRPHVEAFCEVLAYAAGLPPAGVTRLDVSRDDHPG